MVLGDASTRVVALGLAFFFPLSIIVWMVVDYLHQGVAEVELRASQSGSATDPTK